MSGSAVLKTLEGGVAVLTLNRPETFNALDMAMGRELVDALEQCGEDRETKVVIVTGAGKAFCSGGDLKMMRDVLPDQPVVVLRQLTKLLHRAVTDIRLMHKPVIAAVNGSAGGAGFSLAMACDLRVMSEKAKLRQAYTSNGLVPDGGWTAFVPVYAGLGRAFELALLDPVLDASTALEWGLVNLVVPEEQVMPVARQWAERLSTGALFALGQVKSLLNGAVLPSLETLLERERQGMIAAGLTGDAMEGITAFTEKRPPRFKGQ
ncbi:hypothetical protein SY88_22715 [Clostridiales bacterium PH28_bin88]|nr:hypothetical protein SY88_22715 [Clostridiales bacterium PH28_bin88]